MQAQSSDDFLRWWWICSNRRRRSFAVAEHALSLSLASILEVVIDLCSMIAFAFMLFFNDFSSQCFLLLRYILNNDTLNSFRDPLPFSHLLYMINVKINSRFITIDNRSYERPKKVSTRHSGKRNSSGCWLTCCGPSRKPFCAINFGALKLLSINVFFCLVAAQRWINIDYRRIKRKFIKDISSFSAFVKSTELLTRKMT